MEGKNYRLFLKRLEKIVDVSAFFDLKEGERVTVTIGRWSEFAKSYVSSKMIDAAPDMESLQQKNFAIDKTMLPTMDYYGTAFGIKEICFISGWESMSPESKVDALVKLDVENCDLYKTLQAAVKDYQITSEA